LHCAKTTLIPFWHATYGGPWIGLRPLIDILYKYIGRRRRRWFVVYTKHTIIIHIILYIIHPTVLQQRLLLYTIYGNANSPKPETFPLFHYTLYFSHQTHSVFNTCSFAFVYLTVQIVWRTLRFPSILSAHTAQGAVERNVILTLTKSRVFQKHAVLHVYCNITFIFLSILNRSTTFWSKCYVRHDSISVRV